MESTQMNARRWFDLVHAAQYADLPVKCLRSAISRGLLPVARPGRKQVIDIRDLDFWLVSEKKRIEQ